jgi:hypothetical protein
MRLRNIDLEKYTWEHRVKNILNDISSIKDKYASEKCEGLEFIFLKLVG